MIWNIVVLEFGSWGVWQQKIVTPLLLMVVWRQTRGEGRWNDGRKEGKLRRTSDGRRKTAEVNERVCTCKSRTSDANDLCEAFVRGVTYGYLPRLRWSLNTPIHVN